MEVIKDARFLNNIISKRDGKAAGLLQPSVRTLLALVWSGAISFVLGLTLGVLITVTKPGGILENKIVYQILDKLVSLFRSIPFIILLTWVMPVSRAIMGTAIYVRGAIVPLVFGAVPFFTRQVESTYCRAGRRSDETGSLDGLHTAGDHLPRYPEGKRCRHKRAAQPSRPSACRTLTAWPVSSVQAVWATSSPSVTATTAITCWTLPTSPCWYRHHRLHYGFAGGQVVKKNTH